ncbi:MAG: hypothetical protein ACK5VI_09355 [Opitutia bacterium]
MTTYTVYRSDDSGNATQRLTLEEAAQALLTADGHDYEIRLEDGTAGSKWPRFVLWITQFSRNSPLGSRPMVASRFIGASHAEIYEAVLSEEWHGFQAVPDADYDLNFAERLTDSEEEPTT